MSPTYIQNRLRHSSNSLSYEDSTLPLNTPWSTPPSSASGSVVRRTSRRRSSVHDSRPFLERPSSPPRPVVIQKQLRGISPERHRTSKTLVIPASSRHHHDHTRYSNHTSRYYDAITIAAEQESGHSARRGRTRFPKKLISRKAVEQRDLPYTLEADGAVTVLQALGQPDIDALVALTEDLRHRSHSRSRSSKAVSFYEKTEVHEMPPSAPMPPQPVLLVPGAQRRYESTYLTNSPPKFEPLSPPGPSAPGPASRPLELSIAYGTKSPAEKIARAEGKATRAEHRYLETRREEDRLEALKARDKVDEVKRKIDGKRRVGVNVRRNHRGEVVIVKG